MAEIELSVIVPTYNRCARLRECLKALNLQSPTADCFEVVVVVDGSTDDTDAMLASYAPNYPLRVVRQDNSGQPVALNRGIAEAVGRYCLFLDDDIVASPTLVWEHLQAQRSRECLVAAGRLGLELHAAADWYARAFAESWRQRYEALDADPSSFGWEDCYSGNLSVPRELLLECRGFATDIARGFDIELAFRLQEAGGVFAYLPLAGGYQQEHKGIRELSRDSELAGAAEVSFFVRDPRMCSQRLGSFASGGWRKLLLKRALLTLRLPTAVLGLLGSLLPSDRHRASWHAFLQNLCYWRGVKKTVGLSELWEQLTTGTPILMYHAVGAPSERASAFVIPRARFAAHLAAIRRFGFQPISLEAYLDCRRRNSLPPTRSVVITFDDGYLDNYHHALPVLTQHRVPATIFLVTDCVGDTNDWDRAGALGGRPLFGWGEARAMGTLGVSFGPHTRTHVRLTSVSPAEVDEQIQGSWGAVDSHLDRPVKVLAYPFGLHSPDVEAAVMRAGYDAGLTVDPGLNGLRTPAPALHRSEVHGTDSVIRLWLALHLGDPEALWRRHRR